MKARWIGLGIGAALCLAACGDAARPAVVEGSASPADGMPGAGVVAAATAPYARAERALAAGRILAPAGDNAIEHYLDACAQPSERVRAQAALAELQPYVLIAAEQAIARGDGREAARLQALIARIDSGAPALPRLRAGLDALVREQEARDADGAATAMPSPAAGASAAVVERIVAATAATESVISPARVPEPPPAAAAAVVPLVDDKVCHGMSVGDAHCAADPSTTNGKSCGADEPVSTTACQVLVEPTYCTALAPGALVWPASVTAGAHGPEPSEPLSCQSTQ